MCCDHAEDVARMALGKYRVHLDLSADHPFLTLLLVRDRPKKLHAPRKANQGALKGEGKGKGEMGRVKDLGGPLVLRDGSPANIHHGALLHLNQQNGCILTRHGERVL